MKITTRYMINFGLLVACILLLYSVIVIMFYYLYRNQDFYVRLKNKATNSATLLFNVKGITYPMLRIIDDNTITNMSNVTVIILDQKEKIIYSDKDTIEVKKLIPQFHKMNWTKNEMFFKDKALFISFQQTYNNQKYYILASGVDLYGQSELQNLWIINLISFIISIAIIIGASYLNARQSVKPIAAIIKQIKAMNPGSLRQRLIITSHDEIAELSASFNVMLTRIEQVVENERMFVSNVSHELRTPLTSIIGQIEVSLLRDRTEKEYKILVLSVLEDMKKLKTIINGFFALAESDIDNIQSNFAKLRIDELLYSVKDEMLVHKSQNKIRVEFENTPEDEQELIVVGSEYLLKLMVSNLIDNACKFSDPPGVLVTISFVKDFVTLRFVDNGIGIPEEDLKRIFEPLYRAKNAKSKHGHGIGLSIVKRIADIHGIKINIESEINNGTSISVRFPNTNRFA